MQSYRLGVGSIESPKYIQELHKIYLDKGFFKTLAGLLREINILLGPAVDWNIDLERT